MPYPIQPLIDSMPFQKKRRMPESIPAKQGRRKACLRALTAHYGLFTIPRFQKWKIPAPDCPFGQSFEEKNKPVLHAQKRCGKGCHMAKKIYVCYDHENDEQYRNKLEEWDTAKEFEFTSKLSADDGESASGGMYSEAYRKKIRDKIADAACVLCLIGKNTRNSEWVKWEIDEAIKQKKKIIVTKTEPLNTPPSCFLHPKTLWAKPFTFEGIKEAIARPGRWA